MLEKPGDVIAFDEANVPVLGQIIDEICLQAAKIRYTNIVPTATTVHEGELVVYDNGDGTTKRIYVITRAGNLGYIGLT